MAFGFGKIALGLLALLVLMPFARAADLQTVSSIKEVMKRRDPFLRAPSPYRPPEVKIDVPIVQAPTEERVQDVIDPNAPDLVRYPSSQYRVLAILLGDVYPRALLGTPDQKVFVVREKDKLGNRKGVIRRIQEGSIVIVEQTRTSSGAIDRVESRLSLSGKDKK